jgi:hypothetical protein
MEESRAIVVLNRTIREDWVQEVDANIVPTGAVQMPKLGSEILSVKLTDALLASTAIRLPYSIQVSEIWKKAALWNGSIESAVRLTVENGFVVIDVSSIAGIPVGETIEVEIDYFKK